jgi:hypothetical protein
MTRLVHLSCEVQPSPHIHNDSIYGGVTTELVISQRHWERDSAYARQSTSLAPHAWDNAAGHGREQRRSIIHRITASIYAKRSQWQYISALSAPPLFRHQAEDLARLMANYLLGIFAFFLPHRWHWEHVWRALKGSRSALSSSPGAAYNTRRRRVVIG